MLPRALKVVLVSVAFALAAAPADAAQQRYCGLLRVPDVDGYVEVRASGAASCRTARRVMGRLLRNPQGGEGSSGWREYPDGWECQFATLTSFPRIATCENSTSRVRSYSVEDNA